MNLVWGQENVEFLRKRHAALGASPLFSGMEFTTDPKQIANWVPVMMEGRDPAQPLAATRPPARHRLRLGRGHPAIYRIAAPERPLPPDHRP